MLIIYLQERTVFVHGELEVPRGNEIWPKSDFAGDVIKLVMNLLIVQLNYNLPIGVQGVLNPHIGKTAVGSMNKRFVNKLLKNVNNQLILF